MSASFQFPDDENGRVLNRLIKCGDDLSKPRLIDFCFIFRERRQAISFAEVVDERDLRVYISYYDGREMWQVIVQRHMIPTHRDVTEFEAELASRANLLGGEADGWGCMAVKAGE